MKLKIYTNDCNLSSTIESRVFAHLWANIQKEFLREFNYMAKCANLGLTVTALYDNVNFHWRGFNDSMSVYIQESIERILDLKSPENREQLEIVFNQVKDKLLADWKNFYFEQSYQQAF